MFAFIPDGPRMLRTKQGLVPRMSRRFIRMPSRAQIISGITRDSSGLPLAAVTVKLYRVSDNIMREVVVSDVNGAYIFSAINDSQAYYAVAYMANAPDVAGTTVNTLVGA